MLAVRSKRLERVPFRFPEILFVFAYALIAPRVYMYFYAYRERLGCTIQESEQSRRADRASNGERIRGRREDRGGREIGWSGKVRDGW